MHIYGEEAREKIPIKSLPQELQKPGLKPSLSSVYIFYLCNVTSEKEYSFFRNVSTQDLTHKANISLQTVATCCYKQKYKL